MIQKELEGLALHKGAEQLVFLVVAVVKMSRRYRAMQARSQVFFWEGAIQQGEGQNMHQSHKPLG